MKVGIIIYHKDIFQIYKQEWVNKCLDSIRNQTHKDFKVYELCYSLSPTLLWAGSDYEHLPMDNHIQAMNHILDKAFADGCDVVANTNLDDLFNWNRLALQLQAVNEGYDLISTNFTHIDEEDKIIRDMLFHTKDISAELNSNHNILCHPSIMYTKAFWERYKYYNVNELGYEDLNMWKKAAAHNCKIRILPEILCYYRIHENQTGRLNQQQQIKETTIP